MKTNMVVRTTIRVNGKDYTSPEEMPPEIRAAYEHALASLGGKSSETSANFASPQADAKLVASTITFNGETYGSADDMPANVRALYDDVVATLKHEITASKIAEKAATTPADYQDGGPSGSSIAPQSVSPKLMMVAAAILALALLVFGRLVASP